MAVGGGTPLGGLSIVSSRNVDVNDTLAAGADHVDINADGTVTLDQAVTTSSGGRLTITNTGVLTLAAAGSEGGSP